MASGVHAVPRTHPGLPELQSRRGRAGRGRPLFQAGDLPFNTSHFSLAFFDRVKRPAELRHPARQGGMLGLQPRTQLREAGVRLWVGVGTGGRGPHETSARGGHLRPPQRYKQTATPETGCQPPSDMPIIALPALLRLAHWFRERRESTQGGAPCGEARSNTSPPAPDQPGHDPAAGRPVAGTPSGHATPRPASTQPRRRSKPARTTRKGGGA